MFDIVMQCSRKQKNFMIRWSIRMISNAFWGCEEKALKESLGCIWGKTGFCEAYGVSSKMALGEENL